MLLTVKTLYKSNYHLPIFFQPKFFVDLDDQIQALEYEEENIRTKLMTENIMNGGAIYLQKREMTSDMQQVNLNKVGK